MVLRIFGFFFFEHGRKDFMNAEMMLNQFVMNSQLQIGFLIPSCFIGIVHPMDRF